MQDGGTFRRRRRVFLSVRQLGVTRGAALYVGALIGPGLLLVPALAVQAAGAASIVAWAALLVLSAPLAITFAALGVRHPVAGGVSTYVREGLGEDAAAITGAWFVAAVLLGSPAVSVIGGYYVADLTGSGTPVAAAVGLAMFATVLVTNMFGLRISSGFQLALSSVLIVVLALAIAVALPTRGGRNWTPFAPHGIWAIGTAANILVWLFVGWEAVAQLAGEFRRPERDLPRAIAIAFALVSVLYIGLAVATIGVTAGTGSRVPLADLIAVGFGRAGRDATAVLAVVLTMGTMNVYVGGMSKLAASLASERALPAWFAGDAHRSIPRRPLYVLAPIVGGPDRGGARRRRDDLRPRPRHLGVLHRRLRPRAALGGEDPRRARSGCRRLLARPVCCCCRFLRRLSRGAGRGGCGRAGPASQPAGRPPRRLGRDGLILRSGDTARAMCADHVQVRRLTILIALIAAPLVLASCTGADAQKAQDLLDQSQVAAKSVRSEAFSMRMTMDSAANSAVVDVLGGMVLKGTGAGDYYATVNTKAAGATPLDLVMVKHGSTVQLRFNGQTRTMSLPARLKTAAAAGFDLNAITPYVKDVSVSTIDVNGRTEDEVTGTIDGNALLQNLPGVSTGVLSKVGGSLSDIKVSLFIPRDSHLVETALIDMTMHVAKQSLHMNLSYAVTSVNQPLTFP